MENQNTLEFQTGSTVIYGLHGKCNIAAIEQKMINGEAVSFYKLEMAKSTLSRSKKSDPAIWIPVASAKDRGVRLASTPEQVEAALQVIDGREYFLNLKDNWQVNYPKIEALIRDEGLMGLAKAFSFLSVLKNKQVVTHSEVNRALEKVQTLLLRELTEALGLQNKDLDPRIQKGIKQKLLADQ